MYLPLPYELIKAHGDELRAAADRSRLSAQARASRRGAPTSRPVRLRLGLGTRLGRARPHVTAPDP